MDNNGKDIGDMYLLPHSPIHVSTSMTNIRYMCHVCVFFSGFHDNVLQDFVVIAEKIESNFLNHYDFEYITPSQTYSNVTVELKEN